MSRKKMTLAKMLGIKPPKKRVKKCWACHQPLPGQGPAKRRAPAKKTAAARPMPRGWAAAYDDVRRRP